MSYKLLKLSMCTFKLLLTLRKQFEGFPELKDSLSNERKILMEFLLKTFWGISS